MRRRARFQANTARRQIGEELKNSRPTNAPADDHRAISIDAVNLKHQLRNIDPDRDNLAHGRLPSMWLRFDSTTLWHLDAAVGAVHHIRTGNPQSEQSESASPPYSDIEVALRDVRFGPNPDME